MQQAGGFRVYGERGATAGGAVYLAGERALLVAAVLCLEATHFGLGCHRWAHDTLLALGDQDADDLWLVERAELAELAGRDEHARADYERFLAHSTLVTPDHVLALADLLERMPGQGADAAIAVVEAARERLGAAPAFDARLQRLRNPVDTKETPTTDSIPTRADLR